MLISKSEFSNQAAYLGQYNLGTMSEQGVYDALREAYARGSPPDKAGDVASFQQFLGNAEAHGLMPEWWNRARMARCVMHFMNSQ